MKIKLDENIPFRLVALLEALGHDVQTPAEEQLAGRPDADLWAAVQAESSFLITLDMDFSDVRRFVPGGHHGILLIRLHSPSRSQLIDRIVELFRTEDVRGWTRCFVVATERKIRLLKPRNKPSV